ncbi:SDR family NAD(P)-dependent oxidoreductase [Parahaliea mediterranea]|uniref:SDR family NAD(P)-dependent oxidoreductase n=1 Tax=Parahaliea mediterranea TaxID=651086 RepID=UPI001F4F05CB|nr:glucose 1-dehydrogenase [Parahaliea mediterranea]
MLLQDKVGLVTGGGSGIGRATALTFARDGARVAVVDYHLETAQETADMIRQAGGEAIAVRANVAQPVEVEAMVEQTMAAFGRLDCACNNAAFGGGFAPLTDVEEKSWQLAQDVTLKGVWLCMKYQVPQMLTQGRGAIVNIASLSGVRGEALQAPYSAAKGGVLALTRTAAAEYAQRGVRINAVNPGGIRTPAILNYFAQVPGAEERTAATHAMRRLGEPEEVADAVAYLCSDRATFITGTTLDVDGGIMVNPHTL